MLLTFPLADRAERPAYIARPVCANLAGVFFLFYKQDIRALQRTLSFPAFPKKRKKKQEKEAEKHADLHESEI